MVTIFPVNCISAVKCHPSQTPSVFFGSDSDQFEPKQLSVIILFLHD